MDSFKAKKIIEDVRNGVPTADIEKKYAVKLKLSGGGKYDGGSVTIKIQFAEVTASGLVNTSEAEAFKHNAASFGLKPDDLGKMFTHQGEAYKLIGLRVRARRFPFIGENVATKKILCFPESTVLRSLKPTFASVPVPPAPAVGKTGAAKIADAKQFFSQVRSLIEVQNKLVEYGVTPPNDKHDAEEALTDLFLEEMVDHSLNFKR